jgi:type IV pilus assembly protein PilA
MLQASELQLATPAGTTLALPAVNRNLRHSAMCSQLNAQRPYGSRRMRRVRRGFTLIELLVVVVIIGVLAAIAIPRFQSTKGKAYYAGMRSDLRNLMTSQEAFFYMTSGYTTRLDSLVFTPSRGDVVIVTEATLTGWSATSENPESYPHFCAVFVGTATPVAPATAPGYVACQ